MEGSSGSPGPKGGMYAESVTCWYGDMLTRLDTTYQIRNVEVVSYNP